MDRAKNGGFEALTSLYKAGVFIIAFPWRFWGKSGWKSLKQVKKGRQAEREVGNISFFSKSTLYQTYCYVFSGQANGWRVVFPLNAFRICMLLYLHLCLLWKSGSLSEMRGDRRREKLKFGANYISAQQCLLQNWHFLNIVDFFIEQSTYIWQFDTSDHSHDFYGNDNNKLKKFHKL